MTVKISDGSVFHLSGLSFVSIVSFFQVLSGIFYFFSPLSPVLSHVLSALLVSVRLNLFLFRTGTSLILPFHIHSICYIFVSPPRWLAFARLLL